MLFEIVYHGEAPQTEVGAFMERFDLNGDGAISYDEFITVIGELKAESHAK
jgi:Ca2+-binding EF-hand superfamily protein